MKSLVQDNELFVLMNICYIRMEVTKFNNVTRVAILLLLWLEMTFYGSSDSPLKLVLVMRRPAFCICENSGADHCLCFHCIDSTPFYQVNLKFRASSHLLWLYSPVCVDPVGNPKTGFLMMQLIYHTCCIQSWSTLFPQDEFS